jgi:hypothetical protein
VVDRIFQDYRVHGTVCEIQSFRGSDPQIGFGETSPTSDNARPKHIDPRCRIACLSKVLHQLPETATNLEDPLAENPRSNPAVDPLIHPAKEPVKTIDHSSRIVVIILVV